MRKPKLRAVGVPWFDREDYEAFRRVVPDLVWHITYYQWEASANRFMDQVQRMGVCAFKAHVKSDTFVEWCRSSGREVNSRALVDYAGDFARRQLLEQHGR